MREVIEELISSTAVKKRIEELGEQITTDYAGRDITMICILRGGVLFMVDIARCIKQSVALEFLAVSSYGDSLKSSGSVKISMDSSTNFSGKHVIIIEDIIDTGRTLKFLIEHLEKQSPASLKVCTLLDKPDQRVVEINVDYVGFTIPNEFVVGFGLDYQQRYRNLNYIGVLHFEED